MNSTITRVADSTELARVRPDRGQRSPNAMIVDPAAMPMYCWPSNM